eukprot:Ihof_evm3s450 gene=Ihof_evmTU3s450
MVMGNNLWEGIDYREIYVPVCTLTSIRVMLAIAAAKKGADIRQLGIIGAYLNGELDQENYMTQPEGFVDPDFPDHVCRLDRALYGLH